MMHSRWAQPLARRGWRSLHAASTMSRAPASPTVDSQRLPHRRRARSAEGCVSANAASAARRALPIRCHCNTQLPSRGFHSSPTLYAQKKKTKRGRKESKRGKSKKDKGKQSNSPQNRQPTRRIIAAGSDPIKERQTKEREEVPQAFLAGTASPHAYIARCAIMDETSGEVYVDPQTLFAEVAGRQQLDAKGKQRLLALPRIFRNSHFRYFPPSAFPDHALPLDGAPEVAFLGRSNTGKSSLINALSSLIDRSGGGGASRSTASGGGELARTSKRPGRTQTINYFGLVSNDADEPSTLPKSFGRKETSANQSKLYLVDLPGFGYAAAPDQSVDEWQAKTQQFLISRASIPEEGGGRRAFGAHAARPPLRRLYLLVDSRLSDPPLLDLSVMGWCDEYAIPYTVVLTKVDGASRANGIKLTNQLCMRYHSLYVAAMQDEEEGGEVHMDPVVYWTSAKDKVGMEELLLSVEGNLFSAEDDFEEGDDEEEGDGEGWLDYDDDEEDGVYGQAEEEYDVPSRV